LNAGSSAPPKLVEALAERQQRAFRGDLGKRLLDPLGDLGKRRSSHEGSTAQPGALS
jgi:hypothetical protein